MNKISIFSIALLSFVFSSCIVSKKKFDDILAQKIKAEGELADKTAQLEKANTDIHNLNDLIKALAQDTLNLTGQINAMAGRLDGLNQDYEQLNTYYKNLLNSSGKLNRDMTQQKEQLLAIQENLGRIRKLNDSLSVSLAERERKVKELENILSQKDKAVQDLKAKISNALLNFKENDLTVKVKNGKVYVSVSGAAIVQIGKYCGR